MPLITAKEVAERLGVSESFVYDRVDEGAIPHKVLKGGPRRTIRFDWKEIEDWLDERTQRGGEDRPSA